MHLVHSLEHALFGRVASTVTLAFPGIPGTDNEFYVDTSKAGDGDLAIKIEGPDGTSPEPEVTKITEHHYKVSCCGHPSTSTH